MASQSQEQPRRRSMATRLGLLLLGLSFVLPFLQSALLLRGTSGLAVEQMEDLVAIAITESERFYPAFQYVVWGGKSPQEAMASSILETVGEA